MSKSSLLDEPCDLHAEIGSKPWARAVAREIRCNAQQLDTDVEHIQGFIRIAAEHDAWKVLGYVSLDAFLIAEADFSQEIIDAIREAKTGTKVKDVHIQIEEAKANKDRQKPGPKKDELNFNSINSNANENILRRLARDKPELLDKIETGELTVNKAAIQAGIRKKPTPEETCVKAFAKVENRLETLRAMLSQFTETEKQILREWLDS